MSRQLVAALSFSVAIAAGSLLFGFPYGGGPGFNGVNTVTPYDNEPAHRWDDYSRETRQAGKDFWRKFIHQHGTNTGTHGIAEPGWFQTNAITAAYASRIATGAVASANIANGAIASTNLNPALSALRVFITGTESDSASYNTTAAEQTLHTLVAPSNTYRYIWLEGVVDLADLEGANACVFNARLYKFGTMLAERRYRTHTAQSRQPVYLNHLDTGGAPSNVTYTVRAIMDTSNASHSIKAYNFRLWGVP